MSTMEIHLTQGKVAIVDAADYERLNQWKWYALREGKTWYAYRNVRTEDGKRTIVAMHREILDVPAGLAVDHINWDGLDNQRSNLRLATKEENGRNRPAASNNTSGYKGVSWHKAHRKWYAHITLNKKRTYIGNFDSAEDAARAYDKAALEAWGDFAGINFPEFEVTA